jgi:hypothetical protein
MMYRSSRTEPEKRVELKNELLWLDFDPRTSDTMYNYIHVRRPDTGKWERVHNFGIDARTFLPDGKLINTIGMCMDLRPEGRKLQVTYPNPLIQYRQFDDKVGKAQTIRQYPDFTREQLGQLVHADGELQFTYELDAENPSFVMSGRVLKGTIENITYIVSALWTENHELPTHEYVEGFPEVDIRQADATACQVIYIENVAYLIFYRQDGKGVPFAMLPQEPVHSMFTNFYDNSACLRDFRSSCFNQQFVAQDPPVTGCNDAGYVPEPQGDGRFPAVRVVFFPELGWQLGGSGRDLRDRIVAAIRERYWDSVTSWGRVAKYLPPKMTMTGQLTS